MCVDEVRKQLSEYVECIRQIRRLSSVQLDDLDSADEYGHKLRENFLQISEIAVKSKQVAEEIIKPLLADEKMLTEDLVPVLQEFCGLLLDPYTEEDLDLTILYDVSCRLLADARQKDDDDYLVKQLYVHINACYANVSRTNRIRTDEALSRSYRDDGIAAARMILEYLNPDRFVKLNQDSRRYVLIHSRFYLALYDTFYVDEEINEERLEGLWRSFYLSEDPFFLAEAKDYDWNYHRLRCLENMGQLTERANSWRFSKKQLRRILEGVNLLERLWEQDSERNEKIVPKVQLELICLRANYFNGLISKEAYQEQLYEKYEQWSNDKYDMYSVLANVFVPVELIMTVESDNISERMEAILNRIYQRLVDYILHSSNTEAFNFLLEYLSGFLECFMEVSGGMSFVDMGLSCLAAIHPPTYVHCLQVAQISRCICRYLIRNNPETFVDTLGCKNVEDVWNKKDIIMNYMYQGALCHDFGKISQLDTIFVYGRALTDAEIAIIKTHPQMGAFFLMPHPSTKDYVEMALNHHIWFDGTKGYPLPEKRKDTNNRIFCDILTIADCIDSATDIVGRNYNRGKKLEIVLEEIQTEKGSRYSDTVAQILNRPELVEDLRYLVEEGRWLNYRNTYLLLYRYASTEEKES